MNVEAARDQQFVKYGEVRWFLFSCDRDMAVE